MSGKAVDSPIKVLFYDIETAPNLSYVWVSMSRTLLTMSVNGTCFVFLTGGSMRRKLMFVL